MSYKIGIEKVILHWKKCIENLEIMLKNRKQLKE